MCSCFSSDVTQRFIPNIQNKSTGVCMSSKQLGFALGRSFLMLCVNVPFGKDVWQRRAPHDKIHPLFLL